MTATDPIASQVIVFDNYPCNSRDGGPSGFIAQNFRGKSLNNIKLASECADRSKHTLPSRLIFLTKSIIFQIFKNPTPIKSPYWRRWMKSSVFLYSDGNLTRAKRIYFHDVFSFYFCLPFIRDNQQITFQPHMPELPHEEMASIEGITSEDIAWIRNITESTFRRADIIIFPNIGAKKVYSNLISNNQRVIYCASGGESPKNLTPIPLNRDLIYFSFIGRRNRIKGFDLIKGAFERAFNFNKSIRLIIIGHGEEWQHPGVIDLGPSSTPYNWIHSVDYVVNANRQSYFDLSIIESLSVGTPIIFNPTFGHSELLAYNSRGLIALQSYVSDSDIEDSLAQLFISPPLGKTIDRDDIRTENINIYLHHYSSASYAERLNEIFRITIENTPTPS